MLSGPIQYRLMISNPFSTTLHAESTLFSFVPRRCAA